MSRIRLAVLVGLGLVCLTAAAYSRACANGFVNLDDPAYVSENGMVLAGLTPVSVRWAWTTLHAGYWQPLTWLSLQLDSSVFGRSAWGYHLTNVLLHTANVVLLFAVLWRLTRAPGRSALVAALFAVHPLHVESVAWVTERKDVLSTFFLILTVAAYAYYGARPGLARYSLVMLCFALGLLAKPMLVTLPCGLLLLDYWPLRRLLPGRQLGLLLLEKVPLLALSAAASVITVIAQSREGAVQSTTTLPLADRLTTALVGYANYLAATFRPLHLSAFYPVEHYALASPEVLGAGALLLAVTTLVLWQVRRLPYLAVGWFWFLGTLVPVSGLVQSGQQGWADRFSYVPHVGLFVACVWGAADLLNRCGCRLAVRLGLTAALLLVLAVLTWRQVGTWRDSYSLWSQALKVDPDNYYAHDQMGKVYFAAGNFPRAREHFVRSLQARDDADSFAAHYHLGVLLLGLGEAQEAAAHLARTQELRPGYGDVDHNLGLALLQLGRFAEAERQFRAALEARPDAPDTLDSLGSALLHQGQTEAAAACFRRALEVQPTFELARRHLAAVPQKETKASDHGS